VTKENHQLKSTVSTIVRCGSKRSLNHPMIMSSGNKLTSIHYRFGLSPIIALPSFYCGTQQSPVEFAECQNFLSDKN